MFITALLAALPACDWRGRGRTIIGDKYPFENFFINEAEVRRVRRALVVPFANNTPCPGVSKEVTEIFVRELSKLGRFEVVTPNSITGTTFARKLENGVPLDPKDIRRLCETHGADAVIIGEIKNYVPYRPFVLGLKISMRNADTAELIWSIDETLDSGMKDVANAAREYYYKELDPSKTFDVEIMMQSNRMFTQFVCMSIARTLVPRKSRRR